MMENNSKQFLSQLEKDYNGLTTALKNDETDAVETWFEKLHKDYEDYKKEIDYQDKVINSTAGELGSMFEAVLPELFIKNKKAVREITKLIKEDSNIKSQLQFFEAMKSYDGTADAKEYIKESAEIASSGINLSTLKKSNESLAKLLLKHGIKSDGVVNEENEAFFNAGTYLLTHKKKIANLSKFSENRNIVETYINEHKKTLQEDKVDIKKLTEEFDEKMALLNEDERALVNDILNSKSSIAEKRLSKFFNDLKGKCVDKINSMIDGSSEDEKGELEGIKEEIESMDYCKESIVKDTAKLLEIGAVLSDNDNQNIG